MYFQLDEDKRRQIVSFNSIFNKLSKEQIETFKFRPFEVDDDFEFNVCEQEYELACILFKFFKSKLNPIKLNNKTYHELKRLNL